MKTEFLDKEVLAMYDVRGIQAYIFKSNKAKEIIGASVIVANIITDGLRNFIGSQPVDEQKRYLTDWKCDNPTEFLNNSDVFMQVMFVGGGNAYVLFRTGKICSRVNKFLAKYVMEKTYSLNLAVAVVEKTASYAEDYIAINQKMREVKAYMPMTRLTGALPFMEVDSITGFPISVKDKKGGLCTEAKLKTDAFPPNEDEKVFDNMVTKKGDNSLLAVCHIDGNSMGKRIISEMSGVVGYPEAISTMRTLSLSITTIFETAFCKMTEYMDREAPVIKKQKHQSYRKIIVAGDDITFVCNPKLAIPAVKKFIDSFGTNTEDRYSACGGIAFFNSHFPFSDAYQVAEACCESAKKRAKIGKDSNGNIGNYIDFQICTNISAAHLEDYREKHYTSYSGKFIARPYYIEQKNDSAELKKYGNRYDIRDFVAYSKYVNTMPRSKAKQLREAISSGENEIKQLDSFLKSRGYDIVAVDSLRKNAGDNDCWSVCYDAVELMDLYEESLFEGGKDGTGI